MFANIRCKVHLNITDWLMFEKQQQNIAGRYIWCEFALRKIDLYGHIQDMSLNVVCRSSRVQ